ncbi:hypothetical protein [Alistipes shahii]|jgi:hypothetical protein|uniref:hypothetical protein n=1 Tax=Alistipes shahii TaxID=328814 RepID=UPI0020973F99|nr:hypothetical protein [Alistipes shahii]MCO7105390.1 hypothetical protein [Alistipes shahii]
MNRLYYSNSALNSLNLARTYKNELMSLDRNLSALQAEIFMLKLKNELNLKLQLAQYEEQNINNQRKAKIGAIANEIYLAITNAVNALKISIASKNNAMVMLDDNLIQNIASFINEYYKSSEIKEQIRNKLIFSSISWELNQIPMSLYLPGLSNLRVALM